ncbi:MAG: caspase family protein [Planctomycetia bacterium]|nr:caspase family protein [Planctomycetia bacterium]
MRYGRRIQTTVVAVTTIVVVLTVSAILIAQEVRTWTSKAGRVILEATWDAQNDPSPEYVYLLKDGKRYRYPFEKLSEADQRYVSQGRESAGQRGADVDPDLEIVDESSSDQTSGPADGADESTPDESESGADESGGGDPSSQLTAAHKFAVLVGVTDYVTMNNLQYTVRDVEAVREQLLKTGFRDEDILMLTTKNARVANHPTRQNIERSIDSVLSRATGDDLVFFMFAGHGAQIGNEVYFCPQDTEDERISGTAVSITKIMDDLSQSEARFKWIMVDACRNNPFRQRVAGVRAIQKIDDPPPGIVMFHSCAQDEYSYEDESVKHGLFTSNFVKGMEGAADRDHDGKLTFLEVCTYTTEQTVHEAQTKLRVHQRPYLSGNISDFILTEDLNRPKARELHAEATALFEQEKYTEAKAKIAEAIKLYPEDQEYIRLENTIDRFLRMAAERERLAREKSEAERKAREAAAAEKERQRQTATSSPYGSGYPGIPAGRRVNISTSQELHDALEDDDLTDAVLVLEAGTYNLSKGYWISGRTLSVYGNPANPQSVKIRFATDNHHWSFSEGSRGSIIGVDVVGEHGVFIDDSGTSMKLQNCVFHDCESCGIFLTESARAEVRDCEIRGYGKYGISVSESGTVLQAEKCRIMGCESHGIFLAESARAEVTDCEIRDCGDNGICGGGIGTVLQAEKCRIMGCENYGIFLCRNARAEVTNSEIWNNKDVGVWCSDATGTFRGNRLSGNGDGNWYIGDDCTVTRTGNTPNS